MLFSYAENENHLFNSRFRQVNDAKVIIIFLCILIFGKKSVNVDIYIKDLA